MASVYVRHLRYQVKNMGYVNLVKVSVSDFINILASSRRTRVFMLSERGVVNKYFGSYRNKV